MTNNKTTTTMTTDDDKWQKTTNNDEGQTNKTINKHKGSESQRDCMLDKSTSCCWWRSSRQRPAPQKPAHRQSTPPKRDGLAVAHVGRVGVPLLHLLEQLLLREAQEVGRRPRGGGRQGEGGNIAVASWLTQISKTDNSLQENTTMRQLWDLHKILFYYDCYGYQELENIEHDRQRDLIEFLLWDGL